MYIGRVVAIGATAENEPVVSYRVSSRSFRNRIAVENVNDVIVVPSPGHESMNIKNPYVSYTCLSALEKHAVVSNGSHTTIIANKLNDGLGMRDALSQTLVSMDFEHDKLGTPRIAAVIDPKAMTGYLGVVTKRDIHIRCFALVASRIWYISTYLRCRPDPAQGFDDFSVRSAAEACSHILTGKDFSQFEHPVSAAAAIWGADGWSIAALNKEPG